MKGPLGTLKQPLTANVKVTVADGQVSFAAGDESREAKAMSGTLRALVAGMVQGVSRGFEKKLSLVGVGYRDGPYPFERRPFAWNLVATVLRHRETRLAVGGYLGHMWELYAMEKFVS